MALLPKPVLQPGPNHPITITPESRRVRVTVAGQVIADTTAALALQEADYPVAFYIPRQDADAAQLTATDHTSYCPFKGEASYFSIPAGGDRSANAVWSYEQPHDAVAEIGGYLAFYPDRVDEIAVG